MPASNLPRSPTFVQIFTKDRYAVAVGAQAWVWQDPQVLRLPKQDRIWGGVGMVPDYDWTTTPKQKDSRVAVSAQDWVIGAPRNNNLLIRKDIIWGASGMVPDYDWTNPVWPKDRRISVSAQSWVGRAPNLALLKGQDIIWGTNGQVPDYDWPNPTLVKKNIVAQTAQTDAQGNVLVPLYSAFQYYVLRGPLIIRIQPKDWRVAATAQDNVTPDLNLTLLVTPAPPTVQTDWPNPLRPGPRQAESGGNLLLENLQGQDQLPYNQDDWPNPTLAFSRFVAEIAQRDGQVLNVGLLAGQDLLPFDQDDWPLPTWPKSKMAAWLSQPQGSPIPVFFIEATPFLQDDWPIVLPIPRTVSLLSQPIGQSDILNLAGQDALPENQKDWPNPVLPKSREASLEAQPQGEPAIFNLAGQDVLPENQKNWPNPTLGKERHGAALRAEDGVWQRDINLLTGADQLPNNQRDWPNPERQRRTAPIALPPNLAAIISAASPFQQFDWPNPQRSQNRAALHSQPEIVPPIALPTAPIIPADWSNPLRTRASVPSLPHRWDGLLQPQQQIPPFRELDWPNPTFPLPPWIAIRAQDESYRNLPGNIHIAAHLISSVCLDGAEAAVDLAGQNMTLLLSGSRSESALSGSKSAIDLSGSSNSASLSGQIDKC